MILLGCGGGGAGNGSNGGGNAETPSSPDDTCTISVQRDWLHIFMNDWYLWYPEMQNPDPTQFSTVDSYFQGLLWAPDVGGPDRYSYTLPQATADALLQNGVTIGYGARWVQPGGSGTDIRVAYVEPNSPAADAGLQRGDTLQAIDGKAWRSLPDSSMLNERLNPSTTDVTVVFDMTGIDGASHTRSLTSQRITQQPVLIAKTLPTSDGTVGYLLFNGFIGQQTTDQLRAAVRSFIGAGVTDLVLDLRYNSGGFVEMARDLASMIGGSAVQDKVFLNIRFNNKLSSFNQSLNFSAPQAGTALSIGRVFVLSSALTASASELVINALRGVGFNVIQIGGTTYGKPVGQIQQNNCAVAFFPIVFQTTNAAGFGDYFTGLAPTTGCTYTDDFFHALGDPQEWLLAAALDYRRTDRCPTLIASEASDLRFKSSGRGGLRLDDGHDKTPMLFK